MLQCLAVCYVIFVSVLAVPTFSHFLASFGCFPLPLVPDPDRLLVMSSHSFLHPSRRLALLVIPHTF